MPMNRKNYPADWEAFSKRIRFGRALGLCECDGECGRKHGGRCGRSNGEHYPSAANEKRLVVCVLTVAHLNGKNGPCRCEPRCVKDDHVKAMCQGCHLSYDIWRHMLSASETRSRRRGELKLFPEVNR